MSVSGAIISTLSRRGKGCVDYLPKYEMITYTKVPCIPTSHVHMYDPDDVDIACAIFKVRALRLIFRDENYVEAESAALKGA